MERARAQGVLPLPAAAQRPDRAAYTAILALGVLLFWLSRSHPTLMPVWAPWDFSPLEYLATAFVLLWFCRGLALTPPAERPAVWRRAAFLAGLA